MSIMANIEKDPILDIERGSTIPPELVAGVEANSMAGVRKSIRAIRRANQGRVVGDRVVEFRQTPISEATTFFTSKS